MTRLAFGVELHEYLDARTNLEEAQLSERLGYDSVWFGDSQLIWRELYVLMGATAATTSRVLIGAGVTNPLTRHPAVTASAIATLQELSGNRALIGVGVGDSSMVTMGLERLTRKELIEFIELLRPLCRGEAVQGTKGEMRLAYGAPDKLAPIIVGASGPRMLRLAGEYGDGAIITGSAAAPTLIAQMKAVEEGRRASAQPERPFKTYLAVAAAVHPDASKALAVVRPHVARGLLTHMWPMSEAASRASEQLKASYDFYEHMSPTAKHGDVVPDEVVREFAIAGTPAECLEQVRRLAEVGFDEITIRPYAVDGSTRADMIAAFARDVMVPFRQQYK